MKYINMTFKVDNEEFKVSKSFGEIEFKRKNAEILLYVGEIESGNSYISYGYTFDKTMKEINKFLPLYKKALEKYKELLILG